MAKITPVGSSNPIDISTTHTGNGSAGPFAISFEYSLETNIDVTVDGVLKTRTTDYTFTSATQITFTSGNEPANGSVIIFTRNTFLAGPLIVFEDASVLTASDLNVQTEQLVHGVQEIIADYVKRDASLTIKDNLVFEGSTDDNNETTLAITNPTADRTITLPDTTGTVVTTGDTGTVTSTMINDGTIVNADINASAAIDGSKLQAASGSNPGSMSASDKSKLDAIETNADVTDATNVNAAGAVMNSDLDGKGELLVGDGSGDPTALAAGTDGYVLKANSSTATGLEWAVVSGGGSGDVNQNAFSNIAVSGQNTVAADSATDTFTLVAGTNVTITTDASNDTITITAADTNTQLSTEEVQDIIGLMVSGNTETNISVTYDDTNGKLNFASTDTNTTYSVGDGGLTENNFTNALKTKLDGISANANVGITDVVGDTTPQLGGDLDVQTNEITTSTTNGNVKLNPNGTGVVEVKGDGSSADGTIQLNCSQNTHGVKIKSPPHSASADYTFTLPDDIQNGKYLTTDASGNTSWGTPTDSTKLPLTGGSLSGDFTVDTTTFHVDTSTNKVGIGTDSPRCLLDLGGGSGDGTLSQTLSEYQIVFEAPQGTGDVGRNIAFATTTGGISAAINAVDFGVSNKTGLSFATGSAGAIASRMIIDEAGKVSISSDLTVDIDTFHVDSTNNRVGIGTNTPINNLHLHQNDSEKCILQFTNTTTGTGATDGLHVGHVANENVAFWNHEDTDINIATDNTHRMVIKNDGLVGINLGNGVDPLELVHMKGNLYIVKNASGANEGNAIKFQTKTGGFTTSYGAAIHGLRVGDTSSYLRFDTGGQSEKMRLDEDGRLGIGTTNPNNLLHIKTGTTDAITPVLFLDGPFSANDGSVGTAIDFGTGGGTEVGARIIGSREAAGARGGLRFCTGREVDAGFNDGEMVIDSSGNVGIGTANPAAKLHVERSIAASSDLDPTFLFLENASDGGSAIEFKNSVNGKTKLSFGVIGTGANTDDTFIGFETSKNTTLSEKMRIDEDGRLLLGTTTEGHVNADDFTIATSGITGITLRSGSTETGNIFFSDSTSGDGEFAGYLQYNHNDDALIFATGTEERMRVDSSGNVGIGTVSPGHLLHLKGTDTAYSGSVAVGPILELEDAAGRKSQLIAPGAVGEAGVGTPTSHDFTLFTNNTEKIRIKNTGNVGIGTSSPAAALHIEAGGNNLKLSRSSFDDFQLGIGTSAGFNGLHIANTTDDFTVLTLDDSGNVVIPNDTGKLQIGASQDLQLFHDGNKSVIRDQGTGNLQIEGTSIDFFNNDIGGVYAKFISNGSVELYEAGNKKLETTSTGITVTGTVVETSDIALKSNIQPLTNTLEKLQQITGCKYNLINSISPSMGVIAQDVEKVFPELVHGSEGNKTLQYSGLIGVLVEAVKDLSAKVAALEAA